MTWRHLAPKTPADRDPIPKGPGAHPAGVRIVAAAGRICAGVATAAATGAAVGTAAGPVGTLVGAAVGWEDAKSATRAGWSRIAN